MKKPLDRKLYCCILLMGLLTVFAVLFTPLVQFRYPRAIENEPLHSPIHVASVTDTTIELEDGRAFQVNPFYESLEQIIAQSDFRVDVVSRAGSLDAEIFVKQRGWICGTPWAGLIEIPLFPDDIPINERKSLGIARPVHWAR